MVDQRHESVVEVFLKACDMAPMERAAYLDEACGGDGQLRVEVEKVLASDREAASFLDQPALGSAFHMERAEAQSAMGIADREPVEIPDGIDNYRVIRKIGGGGMGVVCLAEQIEPVRRQVALKFIKPGMDSKQVIARFEAERQALAMMDHPNIARVFDAGTTEAGRPYFVMELVKGVRITEYCDSGRLTMRARLELFKTVCQAVHHAHLKGVIHRDIKPSNVLVTLDGERARGRWSWGGDRSPAQR